MSENNKDEKPTDKVDDSTEEKTKKSNIEIYNEKKRLEAEKDREVAQDEVLKIKKDFLETLKATAPTHAKGYAEIFEKKGDLDSAILVLQEAMKNQKPLPNTSSLPQPVGMPKVGLVKYMKYVPGTDKISWEIPMSELLDPEKNKKLGEYQ